MAAKKFKAPWQEEALPPAEAMEDAPAPKAVAIPDAFVPGPDRLHDREDVIRKINRQASGITRTGSTLTIVMSPTRTVRLTFSGPIPPGVLTVPMVTGWHTSTS